MDQFNILINVALLAAFLILLDRSSYAVITGAAGISKSTRLRYSSIGFIYVALSTSLPEAVVSLYATLDGAVELAVGNVLGSNIANVCLILGLPIVYGCLSKITKGCSSSLEKQELSSLFFGLFISSVLPLFILRSSKYGFLIGIVLITLFFAYSYYLTKISIVTDLPDASNARGVRRALVKGIFWTLIGIAGVILSGYAIVYSALNLATAFSLSETFVGATIVAVGTSLPEFAISVKSIQKNRMDFALANAIGSCFANLTIILGLVFVFSKVAIRMDAYFDLVFFSLMSNLFFWYFLSRGKLGAREGFVLLLIYVVFLIEFVGVFPIF